MKKLPLLLAPLLGLTLSIDIVEAQQRRLTPAQVQAQKRAALNKRIIRTRAVTAAAASTSQAPQLIKRAPIASDSAISSLTPDVTVIAALEGMKKHALKIMDIARGKNDYLLFRVGTDMNVALNNWEKSNSPILSKTVKTSDAPVASFLGETDSFLVNVINSQGKPTDINDVMAVQADILTKMPVLKHYPFVYSYSPYAITPMEAGKNVKVQIRGLSFFYGKPKFIFRGKTYDTVSENFSSLSFEIDGKDIQAKSDDSTIETGELLVIKPKDDLTGLETVSLKISFLVLPTNMASFVLNYSHIETIPRMELKSIEYRQASQAFDFDCREVTQAVSGPGRVLKNLYEIIQVGESGTSQLLKSTTTEFTVRLCAKRQNKPTAGFPAGNVHSVWQWEEHWEDQVERTTQAEGKLDANTPEVNFDKLPTSLHKFLLTAKGSDERVYSFNGSGERGLFALRFNPSTKNIILGAKTVEPRLQ